MRWKTSVLLCLIVLLVGCEKKELNDMLFSALKQAESTPLPLAVTHHKPYYSYYLPKDVGQKESTKMSEIFEKDGYRIVMNFELKPFLVEEEPLTLEEGTKLLEETNTYVVFQGTQATIEGDVIGYQLHAWENDRDVLLYLEGEIASFYAYVPKMATPSIVKSMLQILSSIVSDEASIREDFTITDLEKETKEQQESLKHLPSSGLLSDLVNTETKETTRH